MTTDNYGASPTTGIPIRFYSFRSVFFSRTVKGRNWYQDEPIAEEYESKRFTGGGRLIDHRERTAVLDAVSPIENKQILEIACGTGRFTLMLANHGAKVTGIDISAPMLSQGRSKMTDHETAMVDFLRGDAARLPFSDNQFDAVFAIRFFHLADTPLRFLREMQRVSSDTVFFDTFNNLSTRSVYNWLLPMGSHLYSSRDVTELIDGANLELHDVAHDFIVPFGVYRSLPHRVAQPLRAIDTSILKLPFVDRFASVSYWHCSKPTR